MISAIMNHSWIIPTGALTVKRHVGELCSFTEKSLPFQPSNLKSNLPEDSIIYVSLQNYVACNNSNIRH